MKNFIKSFRLTLVFCVFFSVCYILVLWISLNLPDLIPAMPRWWNLTESGRCRQCGTIIYGRYLFLGTSSCAGDGYDATSSAGSNKGPTNAEYLAEVEARIDTF